MYLSSIKPNGISPLPIDISNFLLIYFNLKKIITYTLSLYLNKGGTWNGAIENLKKEFTQTLCWNNPSYKGNIELIEKGATPIDVNWNFTFQQRKAETTQEIKKEVKQIINKKPTKKTLIQQISLFDEQ